MATMFRASIVRGFATFLIAGTASWAFAQQPVAKQQPQPGGATPFIGQPQPGQAQPMTFSPQDNNRRIAQWLAVGNDGQIELAKIAQEKASSNKVKEFAKTLVQDHQKCATDLQKYTANANLTQNQPITPGQPGNYQTLAGQPQPNQPQRIIAAKPPLPADGTQGNNRGNTPQSQRDNAQPQSGANMARPVDFLAVKEQVCKETLADIKKELRELEGPEFDKAFVGMQVGIHHEMIATAKAVRGYVSRDFQQMLDTGVEKNTEHLDQARQLCKDLRGHDDRKDDSNRSRSERRSDKPER